MTRDQAPQQGTPEPSRAPGAQPEPRATAPAPRLKATSPHPQGYGAAFGNGAGAAVVFRDLASI